MLVSSPKLEKSNEEIFEGLFSSWMMETSMLSGNVGELSPTSDKYGRVLQNPLLLRTEMLH
jgi:hypothetical protein